MKVLSFYLNNNYRTEQTAEDIENQIDFNNVQVMI